ncbi:MAG: hypothetical protein GY749_35285 [Desulfobacteraceae bacterium]|nr:hypothetical protein [Desulfobacteraceae bacterium]
MNEEKCIPAGEVGVLVRDDDVYKNRFSVFNTHFFKKIYSGKEYPDEYSDQSMLFSNSDDKILFLALNSSWEIDHKFTNRAGINMNSLSKTLNQLQNNTYDEYIKIAVFHHPVKGHSMMNNDFLQLLSVHGFHFCLHGHIHEAEEDFYKYDDKRSLHIVGAGTFGAPAIHQTVGIPLQYNLLSINGDAN